MNKDEPKKPELPIVETWTVAGREGDLTGDWAFTDQWAVPDGKWVESAAAIPVREFTELRPDGAPRRFYFDGPALWVQIGETKTRLAALPEPVKAGDVILVTEGTRIHINGQFIFDTSTVLS